jgi:heat shock protein HslJ
LLTTDADQYSVAPGAKLSIPVVITNQGSLQSQLRIGVEGIPMVWVSSEHQVILLQPGEQRQIILTIQPPAPPNVKIGRYTLQVLASNTTDPARVARLSLLLTVAGFEVKGRVAVLLEGVQYAVVPGDRLGIPVMLINQGFGADTSRLAIGNLPEDWVRIPSPVVRLEPGEVRETTLFLLPPRIPDTSAGRHPFNILITSEEAPDQQIAIQNTLTVAAFTEFQGTLEEAQPEQNLPRRVLVQNLSNIPRSFQVAWSSPEETILFEPKEPVKINVPNGETVQVEYTAQPARRRWFGGEKEYPYSVSVGVADGQAQTLDGILSSKGRLPAWLLVAGITVLIILCFLVVWSRWLPGFPSLGATVPAPTATLSQIDQRAQLIERNWYLVALNNTASVPGTQEAFILFNPNNTLIGFSGCKDLSGSYQTNYNQLSITNLSLGTGACSETALQQQEDTLVAVLRSARSYFIADTVLQIVGDAGFLNFSLSAPNRPDEAAPPQAVIQVVPQSQVGQVIVFDGSASIGQTPLVSWRWDFGDGNTASGTVVQHTYRNAATFTARLTVTDQRGQTGSSTAQIHVLPLPTASPTSTVLPPTATPVPPTQAPAQPTYTPVPTTEPPTATPEPPPAPVPPQASIAGPGQGFIGEPVKFDASASQPGSSPITSFSWSLGNGTNLPASAQSTTTATYDRAGNYEVTVFVSDANGLSSQASTRIQIDARLDTDVWTLSAIDRQPLLPGTAITMQFLEGELAGFASCNSYTGTYTATINEDGTYTLAIGQVATSRLTCTPEIMTQENEYLTILQQATLASIQENQITLTSPVGSLVFYLIEPR